MIDKKRLNPRNAQQVTAAHIHNSRELVIISRLVPDQLRIHHHSELALETYKRYIGVEDDYKGTYFCSYGNVGYLVDLSLGLDVTKLLLPPLSLPFGIDASAEVSIGLKGGVIQHLLLLIHRGFPKGLQKTYLNTYTDGSQGYSTEWETLSPICFMALRGYEKRFDFKVGASISLDVGFPQINIDGHSLSLNLASLSAAMNAGGRFYRMTDPLPSWYPSVLAEELEIDFARYATPNKEVLKGMIDKWRIHLRDTVFVDLRHDTRQEAENFIALLNQPLSLKLSLRRGVSVTPSQDVLQWLNTIESQFQYLLQRGIVTATPTEQAQIKEYLQNARATLSTTYYQAYHTKYTGENLPRKTRWDGLNVTPFLEQPHYSRAKITVWALGGSASVGIGVSGAQAAPLGKFSQIAEAAGIDAPEVSASLGTATEIKGGARFMSSRYQTIAPSTSRKNMYMTQDTKVTYTQVVWSYSAGAAANLPFDFQIGYEKGREKLLKNDINYYSGIAYWQHAGPNANTRALLGSGINLGTSISLKLLLEIKNNPNPNNPRLKRYPYFLGLRRQVFVAFASTLPASLFEPGFMLENPYIILESSFRFKTVGHVPTDHNGELQSLTKAFFRDQDGKFVRRPADTVLECIRCRIRMGSDMEQTRSVFKLGLHVAGVGAGIGIEKIQRAGNLFMKDVYRWDTPYSLAVQPTPQAEPQASVAPPDLDQNVPATVLLPHTFQID